MNSVSMFLVILTSCIIINFIVEYILKKHNDNLKNKKIETMEDFKEVCSPKLPVIFIIAGIIKIIMFLTLLVCFKIFI